VPEERPAMRISSLARWASSVGLPLSTAVGALGLPSGVVNWGMPPIGAEVPGTTGVKPEKAGGGTGRPTVLCPKTGAAKHQKRSDGMNQGMGGRMDQMLNIC
jgi:hypothetical protein